MTRLPVVHAAVGAWTAGGVLLYIAAPNTAIALVLLAPVAPFLLLKDKRLPIRPHPVSHITAILSICALYLLINASWSPSRGNAYRDVFAFLSTCLGLRLSMVAIDRSAPLTLATFAIGFFAGYSMAAIFILFEVLTDYFLHRKFMDVLPVAWLPNILHATRDGERYAYIPVEFLNRSVTALVLVFWPAALSVRHAFQTVTARALAWLCLTPAIAAIALLHHATSKMAVLGGAFVLLLHAYAPRVTPRLMAIAWTAVCLGIVPVALTAYSRQLYDSPWLFLTAQQRVVIWGKTSKAVQRTPVLGAGVNAWRAGGDPATHPHNAYLQVWRETGAVGAILLTAFGLLLLKEIVAAPESCRTLLLCTFATHALVASTGFNLWAPWLMASFALAAILAMPNILLARSDVSSRLVHPMQPGSLARSHPSPALGMPGRPAS
jgi:O-antigen ligase